MDPFDAWSAPSRLEMKVLRHYFVSGLNCIVNVSDFCEKVQLDPLTELLNRSGTDEGYFSIKTQWHRSGYYSALFGRWLVTWNPFTRSALFGRWLDTWNPFTRVFNGAATEIRPLHLFHQNGISTITSISLLSALPSTLQRSISPFSALPSTLQRKFVHYAHFTQ